MTLGSLTALTLISHVNITGSQQTPCCSYERLLFLFPRSAPPCCSGSTVWCLAAWGKAKVYSIHWPSSPSIIRGTCQYLLHSSLGMLSAALVCQCQGDRLFFFCSLPQLMQYLPLNTFISCIPDSLIPWVLYIALFLHNFFSCLTKSSCCIYIVKFIFLFLWSLSLSIFKRNSWYKAVRLCVIFKLKSGLIA